MNGGGMKVGGACTGNGARSFRCRRPITVNAPRFSYFTKKENEFHEHATAAISSQFPTESWR